MVFKNKTIITSNILKLNIVRENKLLRPTTPKVKKIISVTIKNVLNLFNGLQILYK